MITCLPSCSVNWAANGRANASVPPPAGNGLRNVMGLFGHSCAIAAVPVTKDMQRAVFSNFSINAFLIIILLPSSLKNWLKRNSVLQKFNTGVQGTKAV
jgi:hypothetical protein